MSKVTSERCRAFLKHWESLRDGGLLPSIQAFLENPAPEFQPNVMLTDIVGTSRMPIRLFGTALVDLFRSDQTGNDVLQAFTIPRSTSSFLELSKVLLAHPCGTYNMKTASTAKGKTIDIESISLPLQSGTSSPPCIVGFHRCISELDDDDYVYQLTGYTESSWIDIGAGVPAIEMAPKPFDEQVEVVAPRDMFKTFEDHWRLMQVDKGVPRLSTFLNRPISSLQPHVNIVDAISPSDIRSRLIGTALAENFGTDPTGENILDFMSASDGQILSDLVFKMIAQPCGVEMKGQVVSASGALMRSRSLGFPLRRNTPDAQCIVWLNQIDKAYGYGEETAQIGGLELVRWIDVGSGVPVRPK
ncbi:MAG: PAS domain-containing protein [Rhodospirillaceae bacterium]